MIDLGPVGNVVALGLLGLSATAFTVVAVVRLNQKDDDDYQEAPRDPVPPWYLQVPRLWRRCRNLHWRSAARPGVLLRMIPTRVWLLSQVVVGVMGGIIAFKITGDQNWFLWPAGISMAITITWAIRKPANEW